MLTQPISTSSPIGRKVASLPCETAGGFGVLTGTAGLVTVNWRGPGKTDWPPRRGR